MKELPTDVAKADEYARKQFETEKIRAAESLQELLNQFTLEEINDGLNKTGSTLRVVRHDSK